MMAPKEGYSSIADSPARAGGVGLDEEDSPFPAGCGAVVGCTVTIVAAEFLWKIGVIVLTMSRHRLRSSTIVLAL